MTRAEMELVSVIIDKHTEERETSYCGPTTKVIDGVDALKRDMRITLETLLWGYMNSVALEKKAILHCVVCESATTSETEKKQFYKGYLSMCPVCGTPGGLGITLVSHEEYMNLKKICDELNKEKSNE